MGSLQAAVYGTALTIVGALDNAPPPCRATDVTVTGEDCIPKQMSKRITIAESGCIETNTPGGTG